MPIPTKRCDLGSKSQKLVSKPLVLTLETRYLHNNGGYAMFSFDNDNIAPLVSRWVRGLM
jgi:hypothetical protein